jgi:hypothetical protein
MYTVESILAQAKTGRIPDHLGRMVRGAHVYVGKGDILCLYVSDNEVYWSASLGTPVTEDWVRRFLADTWKHYEQPQ